MKSALILKGYRILVRNGGVWKSNQRLPVAWSGPVAFLKLKMKSDLKGYRMLSQDPVAGIWIFGKTLPDDD